MGGVCGVVDAGAALGTGGVVGAVWGVAKVDEAGNEGAVKGQAVKLPRVAVGPPTSVPGAV
jgi:hypothetical protein